MPLYAVVNSENVVENIVAWDGATAWAAPEGSMVVAIKEDCRIGGTYESGVFLPPKDSTES
ncbi:hypothetical protein [Lonsdalea quercina]|uniref:hypothetical protein n=1 Tax=Lonsdalea quercina TaxID=71657 RepID=UPI003976376C